MAKTALVEPDIEDGSRLIHELDGKGFRALAALWFFLSEESEWRLLIASPIVDQEGPKKAYQMVQSVLEGMSPTTLSLQNISVVSIRDPRVQLLGQAIQTGHDLTGIRFSKNTVNGVFIDDAYIYRLEAA